MKLLLTSAGVRNPSIPEELVGLLGKPIAESHALCIPTAQWAHPMCGPASAWRFISGRSPLPMCDLGWKSPGVVDFSIFPHLGLEPDNTMAGAERWAAEIGGPAYAIDDETAITVVDGTVEVVSEGRVSPGRRNPSSRSRSTTCRGSPPVQSSAPARRWSPR